MPVPQPVGPAPNSRQPHERGINHQQVLVPADRAGSPGRCEPLINASGHPWLTLLGEGHGKAGSAGGIPPPAEAGHYKTVGTVPREFMGAHIGKRIDLGYAHPQAVHQDADTVGHAQGIVDKNLDVFRNNAVLDHTHGQPGPVHDPDPVTGDRVGHVARTVGGPDTEVECVLIGQ
ncbi:hypothetical protein ES703_78223 [subsurface metagenome]